MKDHMKNVLGFKCDHCNEDHFIHVNERMATFVLNEDIDDEVFVMFGTYQGHDATTLILDTSDEWSWESEVDSPLIAIPWENITGFKQLGPETFNA